MDAQAWGVIATILTATGVGGAVAKWITPRATQGERENRLIDQLQEELQSAKAAREASDRREAAFLNYVYALHVHINTGAPPPPPPIPAELLTR